MRPLWYKAPSAFWRVCTCWSMMVVQLTDGSTRHDTNPRLHCHTGLGGLYGLMYTFRHELRAAAEDMGVVSKRDTSEATFKIAGELRGSGSSSWSQGFERSIHITSRHEHTPKIVHIYKQKVLSKATVGTVVSFMPSILRCKSQKGCSSPLVIEVPSLYRPPPCR